MATVLHQMLPDKMGTRYHHVPHTRPYDRTQYQSYVIQYITYVVRTRSTFYVLPSAEPSDIGCLQGADASATGFSEKACRYPSLVEMEKDVVSLV
jgi:hypothetical protein